MASWLAEFRDTAVSVLEQADQLAASNLKERNRRRRMLGLDVPSAEDSAELDPIEQQLQQDELDAWGAEDGGERSIADAQDATPSSTSYDANPDATAADTHAAAGEHGEDDAETQDGQPGGTRHDGGSKGERDSTKGAGGDQADESTRAAGKVSAEPQKTTQQQDKRQHDQPPQQHTENARMTQQHARSQKGMTLSNGSPAGKSRHSGRPESAQPAASTMPNGDTAAQQKQAKRSSINFPTRSANARSGGAGGSSRSGNNSSGRGRKGAGRGSGGSGGGAVQADTMARLKRDNQALRKEIASLEDEVASYASRLKETQDTLADKHNQLSRAERQLSDERQAKQRFAAEAQEAEAALAESKAEGKDLRARLDLLQRENETLMTSHAGNTDKHLHQIRELQEELKQLQLDKGQRSAELRKQLAAEQANTRQLSADKEDLQAKVASFDQQLRDSQLETRRMREGMDQTRLALDALQKEYTEYKQKARSILSAKEALIQQLREGGKAASDAAAGGGLQQSAEADVNVEQLKRDLATAQRTAETLRSQLEEAEEHHQQDVDDLEAETQRLQQALDEQSAAARESEADYAKRFKDLARARDDALSSKQTLQLELHQTRRQLDVLRKQLDQVQEQQQHGPQQQDATVVQQSTSDMPAVLLRKQEEISRLREHNTHLSVQLEKERKLKEEALRRAHKRQTSTVWDDSMQMRPIIPPGVATGTTPLDRRFKTAANALDKFSIRLGVFLRRYPAARILVIVYMILLHVWVMIVLMTSHHVPEIEHDPHPKPMAPHA